MSIREALERESVNQDRIFLPYSEDRSNPYEEVILEEGAKILETAGIPTLLQELAEVIQGDFPDVGISKPAYYRDHTVGMEIRWNNRFEQRAIGVGSEPRFNRIVVSAIPFRRDLRIIGSQMALLEFHTWVESPSVIEDALVHVYRNPMKGLMIG